MKLTAIAIATAFLLSGASGYAQTRSPGSPAARHRRPTNPKADKSGFEALTGNHNR
jgi:hypothetical protein